MRTTLLSRSGWVIALGLTVVALMACGASATLATLPTPTATLTPAPTATATPAPGVCNAADFPTSAPGGPSWPNNSPLTYPPLTYNYELVPGMGSHPYNMCSSGDPASILAFMHQSVTAAGWKVTGSNATILSAQIPTSPPTGYCYTLNIQVGAFASYPGEWSINFHPPAVPCA